MPTLQLLLISARVQLLSSSLPTDGRTAILSTAAGTRVRHHSTAVFLLSLSTRTRQASTTTQALSTELPTTMATDTMKLQCRQLPMMALYLHSSHTQVLQRIIRGTRSISKSSARILQRFSSTTTQTVRAVTSSCMTSDSIHPRHSIPTASTGSLITSHGTLTASLFIQQIRTSPRLRDVS